MIKVRFPSIHTLKLFPPTFDISQAMQARQFTYEETKDLTIQERVQYGTYVKTHSKGTCGNIQLLYYTLIHNDCPKMTQMT